MSKIFLIGGHGKVALLAAPLLHAAGHEVTAVIRNPDHAADVIEALAAPLVLDVEHASTDELSQAMAGFDAVIWSAGAGGGNPERTKAVDHDAAVRSMDAAGQAGVKRYVMVSYQGAKLDHGVPEDNSFFHYAEAKAHADEYLRNTELDRTILGPGRLTLEEPTGKIQVTPTGQPSEHRETSRGNVACTLVEALDQDATIGRQIEYTDGEQPIADAFAG